MEKSDCRVGAAKLYVYADKWIVVWWVRMDDGWHNGMPTCTNGMNQAIFTGKLECQAIYQRARPSDDFQIMACRQYFGAE